MRRAKHSTKPSACKRVHRRAIHSNRFANSPPPSRITRITDKQSLARSRRRAAFCNIDTQPSSSQQSSRARGRRHPVGRPEDHQDRKVPRLRVLRRARRRIPRGGHRRRDARDYGEGDHDEAVVGRGPLTTTTTQVSPFCPPVPSTSSSGKLVLTLHTPSTPPGSQPRED